MIWKPRVGQLVRIQYAAKKRRCFSRLPHMLVGKIVTVGSGPGPINALVNINYLSAYPFYIVVPRGNLFAIDKDDRKISNMIAS